VQLALLATTLAAALGKGHFADASGTCRRREEWAL